MMAGLVGNCFAIALFLAIQTGHCAAVDSAAKPSSKPQVSALDIHGIRHYPTGGRQPAWLTDAVARMGPEYSLYDRIHRHQGTGLLRLIIDPRNGNVSRVVILKSTGFRTLDYAAIVAFRQWRWKPGTWKEVDFPVTFSIQKGPPRLAPGAIRLPHPSSS
jgi:TonB family protein